MKCFTFLVICIFGLVQIQILSATSTDDNPKFTQDDGDDDMSVVENNYDNDENTNSNSSLNIEPVSYENKPCTTVVDALENAITASIFIYDCQVAENWIPAATLDAFNASIASAPTPYQANLSELQAISVEYNNTINAIMDNVTSLIINVSDDITIKTNYLIEFVAPRADDMANDINKLKDTCALVDANRDLSRQYNGDVKDCIDQFKEELVPSLSTVNDKLLEYAAEFSASTKKTSPQIEKTAEEIQNKQIEIREFSEYVPSAIYFVELNLTSYLVKLQKCIEAKDVDLKSKFGKIYTKLQNVFK